MVERLSDDRLPDQGMGYFMLTIRVYDPLFGDLTIALYAIPINAEDGVVTMTLCTCLSLIHVNYFHVTPISMTRMAHIFSSKYTLQKACEKT